MPNSRLHQGVLTICLFAVSSQLFGQDTLLSMRNVTDIVKEQSPWILSAKEDVGIAEAENLATLGNFDYRLNGKYGQELFGIYDQQTLDLSIEKPIEFFSSNLFAGYRISNGKIPIYDGKLQTGRGGEFRIGTQISLWRNRDIDRRRSSFQSSKEGISASQAQLIQATLLSIQSATKKYWDLALANQKLKNAEDLLEIAVKRDRFLKQRQKYGDIPKFDLDDNQRSILQRRSQVIQMTRLKQMEYNQLSVLLQASTKLSSTHYFDSLIPDETDLNKTKDQTIDAFFQKAISQRPEFLVFRALKNQQRIETEFQDNMLNPKLDLQLVATKEVGEGQIPLSDQSLGANLMLEVPFERREAKGKKSSALAKNRKLSIQEELLKSQIEAQIKDVYQSLVAIKERFILVQSEFQLAKKLEEGERQRFEHGESNLIFVNLREQTSFDTAIRFFETGAEYKKTLADLDAAIAIHWQ